MTGFGGGDTGKSKHLSTEGIEFGGLCSARDLECSPMMVAESFADNSIKDHASSNKDLSFGKKNSHHYQ